MKNMKENERKGKYIYCITETSQERNFGPIGISGKGDDVLTIGYDDLSMVVSNYPMTKFVVNHENILAHEKVIEEVMKEFDRVIPVRFGTIASDADEIRNLLDRRYREFKNLLRDMDHKIELGIKGVWKNMDVIFKEITEDNTEIKELKDRIEKDTDTKNTCARMEIGKMVEAALQKKKEEEQERIVDALKRTAFEYKLNKTVGDEMVINAAFLVNKGREKEFDNIMDDLSEKYQDRIRFTYTGPLPVFNFVNIVIYPEEWER
ncbi:MAG: GvpL/GvpF family gas vesicle protein [Candidatus Desantisbacteria bacterium]